MHDLNKANFVQLTEANIKTSFKRLRLWRVNLHDQVVQVLETVEYFQTPWRAAGAV